MNAKALGSVAPILVAALCWSLSAGAAEHVSSPFKGNAVNKGTVSHSKAGGKIVLTLSDDFVVPEAPDPHWQVVDSKGRVYLLDKLKTKASGDGFKKEITVPRYVKDVKKVVFWCAFVEVNLGEAEFAKAVK